MYSQTVDWLLASDEPWTRYRTHLDLLEEPVNHPAVINARTEMVNHPKVMSLIDEANKWPGYALKRHNDAKHPLYKLGTLADFGLNVDDPGINDAI